MGSRVSFDIDGNSDGFVAQGRKARAVVDQLKEAFPGVTSAVRLSGAAIKVTMTESAAAIEKVAMARQKEAAEVARLSAQVTNTLRQEAEKRRLQDLEGILASQSFRQKEAAEVSSLSARVTATLRAEADKRRMLDLEGVLGSMAVRQRAAADAAALDSRQTDRAIANLSRLAAAAQRARDAEFNQRFIPIDQFRGAALEFARTGQGLNLMSKGLRNNNLLMMEGARAAQDFAQVIGQQGVGGAVRASANNIQRMVEIISFMHPGLKTTHVVAAMLGTATLPILADMFFKTGTNAKKADEDMQGFVKRLYELQKINLDLQGRPDEVKEQAEVFASKEASRMAGLDMTAKQAALAKATRMGALTNEEVSLVGVEGADLLNLSKRQLKVRGEGLEKLEKGGPLSEEGKVRVGRARAEAAGAKQRVDALNKLESDRARLAERKRVTAAAEKRNREGGSLEERMRRQFMEPVEEELNAFGQRRERSQIDQTDRELARGGRHPGAQQKAIEDKEQTEFEREANQLRLKQLQAQEAMQKTMKGVRSIMQSAFINGRLPVVPILNANR